MSESLERVDQKVLGRTYIGIEHVHLPGIFEQNILEIRVDFGKQNLVLIVSAQHPSHADVSKGARGLIIGLGLSPIPYFMYARSESSGERDWHICLPLVLSLDLFLKLEYYRKTESFQGITHISEVNGRLY